MSSVRPPVRPTVGPGSHVEQIVPRTLLEELHALDGKFKAREAELQREAELLERERQRFEHTLAAREWALQKEQHTIDVAQENLHASRNEAGNISAYQGSTITIVASGGEITTALETLVKREPESGLAAAARAAFSASSADPANGAGPSSGRRLYIDREAAVTHHVIEWLRNGPRALATMPSGALRQVEAEATHWRMPTLAAHVAERLGKQDAAADGADELEWIVGQLHTHVRTPALARAAAESLRKWLAVSSARRRVAIRMGAPLVQALVHTIDVGIEQDRASQRDANLPLLAAALSCCVLLGAEADGRSLLGGLAQRLERAAAAAADLARWSLAQVSGAAADAQAEEERKAEEAEMAAIAALAAAEETEEAKEAKKEAFKEARRAKAKAIRERLAERRKAISDPAGAPAAEGEEPIEAAPPASEPEAAPSAPQGDAPAAAEEAAAPAVEEVAAPAAEEAAAPQGAPALSAEAETAMANVEANGPEADAGAFTPHDPQDGGGTESQSAPEAERPGVAAGDGPSSAQVPPARRLGKTSAEEPTVHQRRTLASAALGVRERRAVVGRLEREIEKLARVLKLCS